MSRLSALLLLVACVGSVQAFGGRRGGGRRNSASGSARRPGRWLGGRNRTSGSASGSASAYVRPTAAKYTIPKSWTKMNTTYCSARYGTFTTFAAAMKSCNSNHTCTGVEDYACVGRYFFACTGNYTKSYASCVQMPKKNMVKAKTRPDLKGSTKGCTSALIAKNCKNVDTTLAVNSPARRMTFCSTPCARFLTKNMLACTTVATKTAKAAPDSELYLANVAKYCTHHRRSGRGSGRKGRSGSGSASGRKGRSGKGSGKGGKGSGKPAHTQRRADLDVTVL